MSRVQSLKEIEKIVRDYKSSNLSKWKYCNKYNISYGRMDNYIRKLKSHNIIIPFTHDKKSGFTHFELDDNFISDSSITLKYKELEIELKESFNPEHLKKVLKTIGFSSDV